MQARLTDLQHLLAHDDATVLLTVARRKFSAPRRRHEDDRHTRELGRYSLGDGRLEWEAIETVLSR
ncbi:xanthine/CO dehydrogenase XdhC/CoxF family maturation factor [Paraburkholderia youngii]